MTCSQVSMETVLKPSTKASSTFFLSPYLNHSVSSLRGKKHTYPLILECHPENHGSRARGRKPESVLEALALGSERDGAEEASNCGHEMGRTLVGKAKLLILAHGLKVGEGPGVPSSVPLVVVLSSRLEGGENGGNGGLRWVVIELAFPLTQGQMASRQELGIVAERLGEAAQPLKGLFLSFLAVFVHVPQVVECHTTRERPPNPTNQCWKRRRKQGGGEEEEAHAG